MCTYIRGGWHQRIRYLVHLISFSIFYSLYPRAALNYSQQMRHSRLYRHPTSRSATLIFSASGHTYYATSVLSSLPMSDLVLFSVSPAPDESKTRPRRIRTLPVNPYPASVEAVARVPLASFPGLAGTTGSMRNGSPRIETSAPPELSPVSREWVQGSVLGYRDRAGREAQVRSVNRARRWYPQLTSIYLPNIIPALSLITHVC